MNILENLNSNYINDELKKFVNGKGNELCVTEVRNKIEFRYSYLIIKYKYEFFSDKVHIEYVNNLNCFDLGKILFDLKEVSDYFELIKKYFLINSIIDDLEEENIKRKTYDIEINKYKEDLKKIDIDLEKYSDKFVFNHEREISITSLPHYNIIISKI